MSISQSIHFQFLQAEWSKLYEAAVKAESLAHPDPRTACFYSRRALEIAVTWLFDYETNLTRPYKDDLSAFLFEPSFKRLIGPALHTKLDIIRKLGNLAVHRSSRRSLLTADTDDTIAAHYYQTRAIRSLSETFERQNERKALLVMATGAGKTRTVIALCDLLMRCN